MKLKDIIDEQLDQNTIQQSIAQLGAGITEFSKKLNTNPLLAKTYNQDIMSLNQLSANVQKQFQDLAKQQQAEALKRQQEEKIKQQQILKQQQKQQPIMANNQNGQTLTNNNASKTADNV